MSSYTKLEQGDKDEIESICQPTGEIDIKRSKKDITYFMYNFLGLKPYTYQHMIFKEVSKIGNKRIIICSSRQIGKSICLAVIALWAAFGNKYPSGIHKNTKICIISVSDDQAKKLMNEIKMLIIKGDKHMNMLTSGSVKEYFSRRIDKDSRNNLTETSFVNRCTIKCFPPTNKIRGESADITMVDEGSFVDEEIFNNAIEPTISATNGFIILSSTPNGQQGFFYEVFDPFDKFEANEYKRFWFNWEMCENEVQKEVIRDKKEFCQIHGKMKKFEQEYEAKFTVDAQAFFESKKVDIGIDPNMVMHYEWKKTDCVIGIDYGITQCRTVITISTMDDKGIIRLVYQFAYDPGEEDGRIVDDIEKLMERFSVVAIVTDDCPQGYYINIQMRDEKGWPIQTFNFRSDQSDRNRTYYKFRSHLYQEKIFYPNIPELIGEMKSLQEISQKINTSIRKAPSSNDDRIDSFLMSTIPFLQDDDMGDGSMLISNNPEDMLEDERIGRRDAMYDAHMMYDRKNK